MKDKLIKDIITVENNYVRVFCEQTETRFGTRFYDNQIPDMHCHNFFRIDKKDINSINKVIDSELDYRKKNGNSVVQIELFECEELLLSTFVEKEYLSEQIIMYSDINDLKIESFNNKASVHIAQSEKDLLKGKTIDILSFGKQFADFAERRYIRKEMQYKNPDSGINNFICYIEDELIGNCDFFIDGKYGKIEDFDVLEKYQLKGYGSAILNELKQYGVLRGVEILFLQVDSDNSAMEMYSKLGFKPLFNNITYNKKILVDLP